MAILSKVGITSGSLIEAAQITQIIDALTASGSVIDILVTGSVNVEGPTNLGTLGENSQSPLIFNPDASGNSVFYAKNPSGTLTIGTGANPYAGSDLLTLSPLGTLGLNGNIATAYTASVGSILVSGKTGLGTTIPQARLVVSNNGSQSIEMDYSSVLNANYIESYDRSTSAPLDLVYYISPGPTGSHRFYTNGGQRMVINRDGYVGIGTTTPSTTLEVVGGTILNGNTIVTGSNFTISNSYPRLFLTDTNSNSDYSLINDDGGFTIYDDTNSAVRMYILPNGNVGIGTISPNTKFDVNGNVTVTGSITATSDITSAGIMSSPTMTTTNFSSTNTVNVNTTTTNFSASGIVTIGTPGVTNASHIQFWPQDAGGNAYYINDSASIFNIGGGVFGSGTNVLSINGSNNVGIGKTTPNTKLDVNGNTTITGSLTITSNLTLTSLITASGDIRTSANIRTRGGLIDLGDSGGNRTSFINSDSSKLEISRTTNHPILFSTNGSERMRITSGGDVGIGTISPLAKFVVSKGGGNNENLEFSPGNVTYDGGVIEYINRDNNTTRPDMSFLLSTANARYKFYVNSAKVAEIGGGVNGRMWIYNLAASAGTNSLKYNATTGEITKDTSARIYKKDITNINYGLEEVLLMNPVEYKYKSDDSKDIGFIADEMYNIIPDVVSLATKNSDPGLDEGEPNGINYDRLVAVLTKAIQEQQAQIEELKLQVATLISGSL